MAQQNNIWPLNQITFPGMDDTIVEEIHENLIQMFDEPDFAPVFHQKIKEALNGRRHAAGEPPYDDNHFQAALNVFLIDQGLFPNLRLPFPQNVPAEGNAVAAPPAGGRRKRTTKRRGRKQRKTKKQQKRK